MSFQNPSREEIGKILTKAKRIAVVGLSDDPYRTSNSVSQAMQDAGYEIIPVNPMIDEALGVKAVSSLSEVEGPIDIVNVFRRSEFVVDLAKEAAKTNAKVFWTQLNVVSDEGATIAEDAGMTVIMDRCIKVEHSITT
ncbi:MULTISPECIES: CoA-binding protein [Geomicrobium]|uniref:CoA-binding protein n=1 Tax=Geomicrobium sediminis TaxID=1347788 RepID=A0ABS2PDM2_9BACL|nr:CoA-binding protein [Geomicrobium sp. JCM 19038]MBM7633372.1 putative CoA-binding protein [Geomicrobium sediminis]GAK06809.1 succinyl-CoA synthetase, alpha subunit-related enzyme [Geomicrobium sp. JCM 19038]